MMLAGGVLTAAATVAVGALVVVSNSVALADRAGVPLAVAPIVIPAPAEPPAVPVPQPQPVSAPLPEAVPVPAPEDASAPVPQAPVAIPPPAAAPVTPVIPEPEPAAEVSDTLQRAREWAEAQGWDAGSIEAWLAELRAKFQDGRPLKTPVDETGHPSVPESPSFWFGSKREGSPDDRRGD